MDNFIEKGYKTIERKYENFFSATHTSIEQYVTIGKKSEKFEPLELEVVISHSLPEKIKNEVEDLYKQILQ